MDNGLLPRELFRVPGSSRVLSLLWEQTSPFGALPLLAEWIAAAARELPGDAYEARGDGIFVARSARVHPSAVLTAPCIVGERTELRPGAFLRGAVLIGDGCVVGNSCEVKNAVLMDGAQVPHFNYVGDSVLGAGAHLGAGAVISNLRADRQNVRVRTGGEPVETGLRKCGALVGDGAEIGCGAVLCPGAVVGRGAVVYPLTLVRGVVPAGHIRKQNGQTAKKM